MFKVYKDEYSDKKDVYFKLEERNEEVLLIACEKFGDPIFAGNILKINIRGSLNINNGINKKIGLSLDEDGKIKIDD